MRIWIVFCAISIGLQSATLELSLQNAEQLALQTSDRLKATEIDIDVVKEQENAGFSGLFPKLSLQGNYTYLSTLPSLAIGPPGTQKVTFGDHNNYSVGPTLNYTLWDTFASIKNFQALEKLKEAKKQDYAATKLQILFATRFAYIRVQLALEELHLVTASLELARSQQHDVQNRFKAGAGTQLDKLISNRQVLGFELQLKQKNAELALFSKDLTALLAINSLEDRKLEPLQITLAHLKSIELSAPTKEQPQIKSLRLMTESLTSSASAQTAKLFPTVQLFASSTLAYPNGPVLNQINQNTIGLTLSIPLYIGDPTWHLAASKRREALAAKHRALQLQTDINRDFEKAHDMLSSLDEQKQLATEDVLKSAEVAQLYYSSYKAGRSNLTDVQSANNQALQSKVNAARIDAQILNQLVSLMALSGKEVSHENP
ncbi:MAG: TolC family protein [Myxococcaceae bacterium]